MPQITPNLLISWNGVDWIDESAYLISASGSFNLARPTDFLTAGGGTVDQATITLANAAGRFLPYLNAKSFFQRHVRLSVDIGSGVQRIFSGAIDSMSITAPGATTAGQVVLDCVTQEGPYLQRKFDLSLADFKYISDNPLTEAGWFNLLFDRISSPLYRSFDPGMVIIPWLWTDDESVLEECWQAAAACGGVFFTNVLGHAVYRNASTLAKNISSPTETLSRTANSYVTANLRLNQDNLYSDITVEVSTRTIAPAELIWSPDDYQDLRVPPNSTLQITATFDDPVYMLTSFEWEAASAGGVAMDSYMSVSRQDYAQKCVITFTNNHSTTFALIKYLRIAGNPVVGGPVFERTAQSSDAFWSNRDRRTRSVRGNVYVQTPIQAQFLSDLILEESEEPRAVIQLGGLAGNPSRFVGDVVTIQDTTLRNTNITGQIESMSWQLGATYTQDIVVRDFGSVYQYRPYFILDTDTVGGARKIFY